jgi:23S rRNA (uracil1939-C5)-methyltransferase
VINRVAAALKRAIRATSAAPYADAPHRGLVRALQVAVERASQRAQVVVVVNALDPESSRPLLDVFARELDDDGDLHSLWWNGNAERSNVILGARWHHCSGPTALVETIGNARIFFPPGAFGQSHLALADRIVAAVHALARGTDRIAEWYAGCGAFGLGLLARGADVAFNEESPHALTGLGRGIEELGTAAKLRAEIVPGRAGDCPQLARDRELGLVDPPRRGLDPELLAALCAEPPPRLAYVSCGVESLERDARAVEQRAPATAATGAVRAVPVHGARRDAGGVRVQRLTAPLATRSSAGSGIRAPASHRQTTQSRLRSTTDVPT